MRHLYFHFALLIPIYFFLRISSGERLSWRSSSVILVVLAGIVEYIKKTSMDARLQFMVSKVFAATSCFTPTLFWAERLFPTSLSLSLQLFETFDLEIDVVTNAVMYV